jgi:thiamine kinase-like enzyme
MDSLIEFQKISAEHCDVSFRNFVFIIKRYKVIDFDSSILVDLRPS